MGDWPRTWQRARTTASGRSAASRSALHPLPGDDLGGVRPRGRAAMEDYGLPGPLEEWRAIARRDPRRGPRARATTPSATPSPSTTAPPRSTPSLLVLPLVGFVDGDDPRMLGTIEAIEQDLMRDGLVLRYRTETGVDGLAGDEHPFLACSFWLVSAYAAAGRLERGARAVRPAGRAGQRRRTALGGVRPRARADGRQLPAGVQPPGARAGGVPARRRRRPGEERRRGG